MKTHRNMGRSILVEISATVKQRQSMSSKHQMSSNLHKNNRYHQTKWKYILSLYYVDFKLLWQYFYVRFYFYEKSNQNKYKSTWSHTSMIITETLICLPNFSLNAVLFAISMPCIVGYFSAFYFFSTYGSSNFVWHIVVLGMVVSRQDYNVKNLNLRCILTRTTFMWFIIILRKLYRTWICLFGQFCVLF